MQNLAPIALFVYNRLSHTQLTIEHLRNNELAGLSDLVIFSDGYKTEKDRSEVDSVRNYLKTINGFNTISVIEREKNLGLAENIINGVSLIVEQYEKIIVVEDDLLTSPYFLKYMNEGLNLYKDTEEVISIHGYVYPTLYKLPETFFLKGADCWGWATWKDKWKIFEPNGKVLLNKLQSNNYCKEFDFDNAYPYSQMLADQIVGKNASWAIRWYASAFLQGMVTLFPSRSLVYHNGNDGSGTHFNRSSFLDVELSMQPIKLKYLIPEENKYAKRQIIRYLKYGHTSFYRILIRKTKRKVYSILKKYGH